MSDVRVIEGTVSSLPGYTPERSVQQKHTHQALDQATKDATEALRLVRSAVDWLSSVSGGNVANREAPHYVNKLIEEIAEARRVRH